MLSMIQQADNLLAQLDPNIDFNSPTWQAIKQLLARLGITLPEVPSISELRQQLAAKQTELQTQRDSLTQQKADLQRTLNETIAPAQSTLDQQNAQLTAKEQEAAAGEAQLNTKSAELEANAATLETQSAQLEAQAAQLASGKRSLNSMRSEAKRKANSPSSNGASTMWPTHVGMCRHALRSTDSARSNQTSVPSNPSAAHSRLCSCWSPCS